MVEGQPQDHAGEIAVVIGAGQGIGLAVAVALARSGALVVGVSRHPERVREATPTDMAGPGRIEAEFADVAAPETIAALAGRVSAAYGSPTVLVNAAGHHLAKPAIDCTVEEWDAVHDTQLRGTFFSCQAFGKAMIDAGYGKIVNIGSTWATRVGSGRSIYGIAKAGVSHMTSCLAVEWAGHGVRVNAVAPGATLTPPVVERLAATPGRLEYMLERIPLGRLAEPADVVGAVLFLAGRGSDYVTGQTLYVDGGFVYAFLKSAEDPMGAKLPGGLEPPTVPEGAADLPLGMEFHPRLGLIVHTMVARQLATHTTLKRPTRHFATCTFDTMAGNTMLSMHLASIEVGVVKCDHRHLDETATFILSGRGFSEYRQSDDASPLRVDWEAGDLLVIPTNAWHRHVNTDVVDARQISFRTSRLMTSILHGGAGDYGKEESTYHQGARFADRFADEPDYFTSRETVAPGRTRLNFVKDVAGQQLPDDDPSYGTGVAVLAFAMGGQRITDLAVARIRAGGHVRPHRPIAEEAMLVLEESGRTDVWTEAEPEPERSISWSAGDLVSVPLGAWRRHRADDASDVRLLLARNTVIERSLGLTDQAHAWQLDHGLPDRYGPLVTSGLVDLASA